MIIESACDGFSAQQSKPRLNIGGLWKRQKILVSRNGPNGDQMADAATLFFTFELDVTETAGLLDKEREEG